MVKINDTTTFPNTTPSLTDHVPGTDVSNTSNSADGEVVTFLLGDILALTDGFRKISTTTLAADAQIDLTGFDSSTYGDYEIWLRNVIPATDAVALRMRTSTDGGSTYDSGASDYYDGGTANTIEWTGASASTGVGSDTNEDGVSGVIRIFGPHLSKRTMFQADLVYFRADGTFVRVTDQAYRAAAADVDAVRLYFSSGNFESGEISFYGRVK